ncbi:GNAT family N-acetyltransferase [Salinarimonas soli]|uniref:GNAT family N-acetyltransferase n=1 Tax=Salinarimonas soli TaxID=1638099 RepID=A0A5B2VH71_9HYPH|nr:GNAT family N-acetyltransferase [Salinarimonas soli]KAA2238295.1 GNAT family N-acetyltransferase [Salinarimonas soli]
MTAVLDLIADRDVAAPRRAAPDLAVELHRIGDLDAVEPHWRALFVEAIEPNPFLGPDFLRPLGRLRAGRIQVALVWRGSGAGRRLAALLPFTVEPGLPLIRPPLLRGLADPFVVNATPLVGADGTAAVIERLLAELSRRFPRAVLVMEPLRLHGPVAAGIAAAGRPTLLARSHERAAIRAGLPSGAYLEARVPGKRVRELRRCEKRLSEAGTVETRTLWGPAAAPAVNAFLAIEAAGWKGRQGTALASKPAVLAFAREALSGTAPMAAADLMRVDGKPIAAALHLVAGDEAVAFKCAYDETWSRASPGALLDVHTLLMTLDGGQVSLMDSGALPGHPVEGLWRERVAFGRLLVDLRRDSTPAALERVSARLDRIDGLVSEVKARLRRALGRKATALRSA